MLALAHLLQSDHVARRDHIDLMKFKLPRCTAVYESAGIDQDEVRVDRLGERIQFLKTGNHFKQAADGRGVADEAHDQRVFSLEQVGCLCVKGKRYYRRR